MPTYDYKCNACRHTFELFQSMSESNKRKCPKCGKSALERLIGTGAAVMFKGSGFYQTDYRSESYKKSAEADKPAAATPETSGNAKPAETKAGEKKPGEKKAGETSPAPSAEPAKPAVEKKSSKSRKGRRKDE